MPCPTCGAPYASGLESLIQRVTTLEMNEAGVTEDLVGLQYQVAQLRDALSVWTRRYKATFGDGAYAPGND